MDTVTDATDNHSNSSATAGIGNKLVASWISTRTTWHRNSQRNWLNGNTWHRESASQKCISFKFNENTNITALWFGTDLAELLGYDPADNILFLHKSVVAERPMHLTIGFDTTYIDCDVLEHVLVGGTKTPLLGIVHRKGEGRSCYSAEYMAFSPVQYILLQNNCFYTITIHMMSDIGEPVRQVARSSRACKVNVGMSRGQDSKS